MRQSLTVYSLIAVAVIVMMVLCGTVSAGSSYQNSRNKPRTIRGFKNVALSTARGFGKRDGQNDFLTGSAVELNDERGLVSLPVEWLVQELRTNPKLARIIIDKFVDVDQDGELSPEEFLRATY